MEYYILLFVGAVIYLLLGLNEVFKKPEFRWVIFVKNNIIPLILNIVCGGVLIYLRYKISDILPITELTAIFLGLSGQVLFKKVGKAFNTDIETMIGRNK